MLRLVCLAAARRLLTSLDLRSTYSQDESFSSLFYELAVRRTIPRDDLIITHCRNMHLSTPLTLARQTQVYEFGTPASLGLYSETEIEMRGYTKDVWEKSKALERSKKAAAGEANDDDEDDDLLEAAAAAAAARRSAGPRPAATTTSGVLDLGSSSDSEGISGGGGGAPSSDSAAGGAPNLDGLFPLTIRGSSTRSLSLAVKPSTTMAQLVRAYCKQFKLVGRDQSLVLEFEGDTIESTRTIADVKEEFDLDGEETFDVKEA